MLESHFLEDSLLELPLKIIEVLEDICIQVVDINGCTIYYSKGCETIEQYKREDILGKNIRDTYRLDENVELTSDNSVMLGVLQTGKPIINEVMRYITQKGQLVNVITSAYPIFSNDKLLGAIAVFKDISQIIEMSSTITRLQHDLLLQKKIQNQNGTQFHFDDIIGSSTITKSTIAMAKRISLSSSPILIVGATGTGKELFAQSIHNYGPVSKGPFVAINCSSIPETLLESILFGTTKGAFTGANDTIGLFEQAKNGTLFLDELNSTSLAFQASLLRVLETNKIRRVGDNKEILVNGRIISATNIDPVEAIKKAQLRPDLYYRLSALTLEIPTLVMRFDDIYELANSFIRANNQIMGKNIHGISDEAYKLLKNYNWPGNIRQLKHCIDYSMNMTEIKDLLICSHHLPKYIVNSSKTKPAHKLCKANNLKETLNQIEREIIIKEINSNNGNLSRSAKNLGISRQNLQYRLGVLKIFEPKYKT
ncbi:PAS domain S-box [Desulfosporosinus orientis DSM 765]|uniref:PAS domain S-box n=1 Tax=Desulfosporosinus orientis (strain ATCC 19365 / DSM 765 / NCIMB 8382 / VKM B-1628 / Singapore I) TaxID=768706 RepID=G7W8I1_DESOD|nr:sigma-54-dependent Fis family transcriptional regulator [Desulfosporosinus orientis]AET67408.1 PAS domain S-box [Desulfosporosinus orientis DSM 765]